MDKAASTVSYTASAAITIMGLSMGDWMGGIGIILGIGTFFVNWYYKRETLKLQQKRLDDGK